MGSRLISFAAILIIVLSLGYILVIARSLLIPLIFAVLAWHLLNTTSSALLRIPVLGPYIPSPLRMLLAIAFILFLCSGVISIITNNVTDVLSASSRYQDNLLQILNNIDDYFHIKVMSKIDNTLKSINIQSMLVNFYGFFTTITSNAILIVLYIIFLFFEQHVLRDKINALFPQPNHQALVNTILTQMVDDMQTYLGIKVFSSLLTAILSWILMRIIGLDFAEFWALLIFFLNFIPNIGAIIATLFPALLAVIQFQTWTPFLIIISGITVVQFCIGNLLEPRLMGNSLNLSPFVILITLTVWGSLWGVVGMFLSVPITVMMMIAFSHFEFTKPVAILLSQNGNLKTYPSELQTLSK